MSKPRILVTRLMTPAVEARLECEHGRRFWLLMLVCWVCIAVVTAVAVAGGA